MEQKISIFGILVIVGAVLALISVFLNWMDLSVPGVYSDSATGWDIFIEENGTFFMKMPLVIIVMAVSVILLGILDLMGKGQQVSNIAILIIGVLVIALSYLAYNAFEDLGKETLGVWWSLVKVKMGYGIFLAFASGIIMIIAPILKMAKVLPE
ncbi:MAG: hypothetical protein FWH44_02850 [Methanomassiliicoccaceae archaeon]|nr:hypothetical protein [Methanomassiliicoccaceae archaeon]